MSKHYVYFYFMRNEPKKIVKTVSKHSSYWDKMKPENFSGGPFGDHTGGMIMFDAENLENATELAMNDPFVKKELVEKSWVKEWIKK